MGPRSLQCLEHSVSVSTTLDILDEGDIGPSGKYQREIVVGYRENVIDGLKTIRWQLSRRRTGQRQWVCTSHL
jgi:hypothetical protein